MSVDELVPLTNGLSVTTGPHTFVCDRARVTRVSDNAVDVSFWIAGTDFAPRFRLTRDRLAVETPEHLAGVVRNVARRVVAG
jgi:hypothetical protein